MKIIHCCLSCFYIDNYNYQENVLPRQNKLDGHNVIIIASTETFINNSELGYVEPREYINEDGIPVKRIPYRRIPINFIRRKIRSYRGVYKLLEEEQPDVILFHGLPAWELNTVVKYKRSHPEVKIYVDSHEDFNNSATSFISRNILHKLLYKSVINKTYPYIDKILYISYEVKDFLNKVYKIPDDKMEFYPLGGTIIEGEQRQQKRDKIRNALKLSNEDILFVHSGKLDKLKRTQDILKALAEVPAKHLRLVIIGSIPEDMKPVLLPLIEADKRVDYIGWKTTDELMEYLCAADVYIQPGSQSATMQNAICCGCVMMLYPHKSHQPYLQCNGFYVKTTEDMRRSFKEITDQPSILKTMSDNSMKIAMELLDYRKLAARLYNLNKI